MAIGVEAKAAEAAAEFKLVGFKNFVRANPRSDRFPVHRFHHIEFWTGDASTAAARFSWALGMTPVAKSDLSTGNPFFSSVTLRSGDLTFVFTSPYSPSTVPPDASPSESSPLPSFSVSVFHEFIAKHGGLAVRAVALKVEDAESAYSASVADGAIPSFSPSIFPGGSAKIAEVKLYGDVVLRYISADPGFSGPFLPGYQQTDSPVQLNYGLARLDHAVGNVPVLADAVRYVARFTGFHEFAEFTADDIGTGDSGLNSMVLANNEESVLLPMNEPVFGTKRKSQIQTYLEHNEGAGVQHLAISTVDIFSTLREMRKRTAIGGFDFMPAAPPTYYRNLHNRVGDVLTEDQIRECEELGILVDRDDQGVLLQIFTKPVGDRPTLFLEIIQRVGCMLKDEKGKDYQKGGCGGFGKGNFSELFKSIEEYEKTLECKSSNNNQVTSQA